MPDYRQSLLALSNQLAEAQRLPNTILLALLCVIALIVHHHLKKRPIRFGLRTLISLTTLVASALGLIVAYKALN
jgi:hypothetical protein